ncbi:hypothetical protein SAMN05428977_101034 [Nitrosomonas sp. Nm166]|nr:hypothetical protein SAMN05428977_101034 [Nitrosomonas sp. Nm166]
MNLPGFTGELVLYPTARHYQSTISVNHEPSGISVVPSVLQSWLGDSSSIGLSWGRCLVTHLFGKVVRQEVVCQLEVLTHQAEEEPPWHKTVCLAAYKIAMISVLIAISL